MENLCVKVFNRRIRQLKVCILYITVALLLAGVIKITYQLSRNLAQAVTLLIYIRAVQGSNLGLGIDYPD
jgi:hypothetical protein